MLRKKLLVLTNLVLASALTVSAAKLPRPMADVVMETLNVQQRMHLIDTRGKNDVASPLGEWTRVECVCQGGTITIKINGETMIDQEFAKLPGKDPKDAPKEGIIAFQAHGGYAKMRIEFTDIKFTDLSNK